jgi:major membrane immunogen (membrane-anchored lipoprotein)
MKKLIFILSLTMLLVACGKSKEQIVDKCLLQANQTFPDSMKWKIDHFENCMNEKDYYLSDHKICNGENPTNALSAFCYNKN